MSAPEDHARSAGERTRYRAVTDECPLCGRELSRLGSVTCTECGLRDMDIEHELEARVGLEALL